MVFGLTLKQEDLGEEKIRGLVTFSLPNMNVGLVLSIWSLPVEAKTLGACTHDFTTRKLIGNRK